MNSADQYLRALYLLEQVDGPPVATGRLAEVLEVSPASVTEMVGKLADDGRVTHEKYRGATLTETGRVRAREVLQTYCILERFLANVLGVDAYREEAASLEVVIDETVADRLDTIIDRRSECPECFDATADRCVYLEDVPSVDRASSD